MISNLWRLSSIWGWRSRCDWREKRAKLENAESAKCRLDSTHVIFTTMFTDWTQNISFDGTFLYHSEMFHSRIWLWGRSDQFFDLRLCVNQVIFFAAYIMEFTPLYDKFQHTLSIILNFCLFIWISTKKRPKPFSWNCAVLSFAKKLAIYAFLVCKIFRPKIPPC